MKQRGTIEHTVYRNNDNGYSVVLIDVDGEPVTITGNFPVLTEGEIAEVEGEYKTTKYGLQFVCTSCSVSPPNSDLAIMRYLASGLIKGVGEATAENIVKKFGSQTLYVIENQPHLLRNVKGISAKRAVDIANNYAAIKKMQKSIMFLQGLGLTINMAMKIYEKFGDGTEVAVLRNPYRLIEDIDGIGFATADEIAKKLGIDSTSDFRLRAATLYVVKDFSESTGSTYIPENILISRIREILSLKVEESAVLNVIQGLVIDMQLKTVRRGEEQGIALLKLYNTERNIARKLGELMSTYVDVHVDVNLEIAEYERANAITLHSAQKQAIIAAVNEGVVVITGGPGTGKTTIINCILRILTSRGIQVELVAPTGRAAKRLSETTGGDAKTIHRLLDIDFKDGKGHFTYNENTRLDCGAVICDEVSMVDAYLMNNLVQAINVGSRLILVGDKDQLPSVGAGNVLGDVIASGKVKVVMLTEIYRQGSDSLIITNAHRINSGEMPTINNNNKDFFFSSAETPEEIAETVVQMVTMRIPKYKNVESTAIQVLCPMKRGVAGSFAINEKLQQKINPRSPSKGEICIEGTTFRLGDKVMQMANNYQLEWRRGFAEIGSGVFNGDIGFIIELSSASGEMTIEFEDGRQAIYSQVDAVDLALSYAISIHKSQGSEFDIAVIPITGGHRALFTRNLLYTGVTRAKNMVVIVGSKRSLKAMIDNDYTEKRYSLLADFLTQVSADMLL